MGDSGCCCSGRRVPPTLLLFPTAAAAATTLLLLRRASESLREGLCQLGGGRRPSQIRTAAEKQTAKENRSSFDLVDRERL